MGLEGIVAAVPSEGPKSRAAATHASVNGEVAGVRRGAIWVMCRLRVWGRGVVSATASGWMYHAPLLQAMRSGSPGARGARVGPRAGHRLPPVKACGLERQRGSASGAPDLA